MLFYTHLCIARVVLQRHELIQSVSSAPDAEADYYLGSILPDVRYFSEIPREQTHPDVECFLSLCRVSDSRAFALGYLVHLVLDSLESELSVISRVQRQFWFFPHRLRMRISPLVSNALVESYYLENVHTDFRISDRGNSLTSKLGIEEKAIRTVELHIDAFLRNRTLENVNRLLRQIGLANNERISRYLQVAAWLDRRPLIRKFMMWRISAVINTVEQSMVREVGRHLLELPEVTDQEEKGSVPWNSGPTTSADRHHGPVSREADVGG